MTDTEQGTQAHRLDAFDEQERLLMADALMERATGILDAHVAGVIQPGDRADAALVWRSIVGLVAEITDHQGGVTRPTDDELDRLCGMIALGEQPAEAA